MHVALPSAIAFGVTIYTPLGAAAAAQGALAAFLGATALGLIAPAIGGARRLITAPCASAAAVLSGFAIGLQQQLPTATIQLIAQGFGNIAAAAVGEIPGAVTMGATLVNLSSGATSNLSGIVEGALALVAFPLFGALAGILIVIGLRMIDVGSLHFLTARSTVLNFAVIVSVVAVALNVSLISVSGVGIVLAILLFVREHSDGNVVRRKTYGNQICFKQVRLLRKGTSSSSTGRKRKFWNCRAACLSSPPTSFTARSNPS